MKMEASITAPRSGRVQRTAINSVQQVEGGDLVLVLGPAPDGPAPDGSAPDDGED